MARSRMAAIAFLGLSLLAGACKKEPPAPPAAPPPAAPQNNQPPAATNNGPAVDPNARAAEEARIRALLSQRVFFDYDDSSIRSDSRQTLDAKVPLLRQNTGVTMMIEGHADERGSTEYNLALGTRRAMSVRDYLVGFGLDGGRFRTVSYGEERPLAQGQSENAWSQNRRAEFIVSGNVMP